jgi:hypothetical protein
MITDRRDFVMRMIKQLADALARAMKLRREKKLDEALQALGDVTDQILGVPRPILDSLDPKSAAAMLANPFKVRIYARIVAEEAELAAARGLPADTLRARATALATLGGKADASEEGAFVQTVK